MTIRPLTAFHSKAVIELESVWAIRTDSKRTVTGESIASKSIYWARFWLNYISLLMLFAFFVGPDYFGLTNPLEIVGVSPWDIIGASELLFTVLAFGSLLLLISVADSEPRRHNRN